MLSLAGLVRVGPGRVRLEWVRGSRGGCGRVGSSPGRARAGWAGMGRVGSGRARVGSVSDRAGAFGDVFRDGAEMGQVGPGLVGPS